MNAASEGQRAAVEAGEREVRQRDTVREEVLGGKEREEWREGGGTEDDSVAPEF